VKQKVLGKTIFPKTGFPASALPRPSLNRIFFIKNDLLQKRDCPSAKKSSSIFPWPSAKKISLTKKNLFTKKIPRWLFLKKILLGFKCFGSFSGLTFSLPGRSVLFYNLLFPNFCVLCDSFYIVLFLSRLNNLSIFSIKIKLFNPVKNQ